MGVRVEVRSAAKRRPARTPRCSRDRDVVLVAEEELVEIFVLQQPSCGHRQVQCLASDAPAFTLYPVTENVAAARFAPPTPANYFEDTS